MRPLSAVLPDLASSEIFGFTIGKGDIVPPGEYMLGEIYCDDKRCDCRRVVLYVLSRRGKKPAATISFGFDPDGPDPGPSLDPFSGPNGKHAEGFLTVFVELINAGPGLVEGLQRHYVSFREAVTRKKYQGKPFPRPGAVKRVAMGSWGKDGLDELRLMVLEVELALHGRGPEKADRALVGLADRVAERLEDYVRLLASDYADPEAPGRRPALLLLERALGGLKLGIESGREEPRRKVDAFQEAVIRHIAGPLGRSPLLIDLLQALQGAKLEPSSALREACLEMDALSEEFLVRRGPPDLTPMFEEAKEAGFDTAFDFYETFLAQLQLLDPDGQVAAIAHFSEDRHPLAREVATLMLLHPNPAVRGSVAAVLGDRLGPQNLSPEALRRLVILRNWVPEEERPGVDGLIRDARRARVECAPLPTNDRVECFASTIDGSGAQALGFSARDEEGGMVVGGVVVRQGFGIRDAFCHRGLSKREAAGLRRDMEQSVPTRPVGPQYVEKAVSHAIHEGFARGSVAPPQLLQLAEVYGGDRWKANPLVMEDELARLEAEVGPPSPEQVARVFAQSAGWPNQERFADTWFENDVAVEEALKGIGKRSTASGRAAVLAKVLEPRRQAWVERLIWMALWAREGKPLRGAPWQSFFVLARELAKGRPMAEIPLMSTVADLTVTVARADGG